MMRRVTMSALAVLLCAGTVYAAQAGSASEQEVLRKARSFVAAKQLEEANELLSEYSRKYPTAVAVLVELGKIQLAQHLSDDATRSFGTALALDPKLEEARTGEVKAVVESALADRNAGDNDGALSCLVQGLKLEPDSIELLLDFGIQADAMRIYVDADKALTHAHELEPQNAQVLYALAHIELDEQKMPQAEIHLKAYLKMRPDDASAYYGLGHLLHMLDKEDEAKQALERSIALQPRQTESYYELGEIALNADNDTQAKAEYARVLALDPAHGGALTGMGVVAFRAKDYSGAETYLQKAVQYAPQYVKAHQFYAMTLEKLGQNAEAREEFSTAQSLAAEQSQDSRGYHLLTPP
jgi:tetratricopeptide (TPR) repeat protein